MAYRATVIPVMIASPSDVLDERAIARDVIHEWNYIHSVNTQVVLMPVGWDTHSAPDLGGRPQDLINNRVLDDCDVLIGVFWTRLGTPTGKSASGTVEEIRRHVGSGKLAMVYFSDKPVQPGSFDSDQYAKLKEFENWCRQSGLYEKFSDQVEFRSKLRNHLPINLQRNDYMKSIIRPQPEETNISGSKFELTSHRGAMLGGELIQQAKQILILASKSDGTIMRRKWLNGDALIIGQDSMGDLENPRELAAWEHALKQLIGAGYIEAQNSNASILKLTKAGFDLGDTLAKRGAADSRVLF